MMANPDLGNSYELHDDGVPPDAETVLFLPGVNCGAWLFRDALKHFLPHYRVILFNNPGIDGAPLPFPLTVSRIAATARAVLDACNVEKAHIIGHSMGGFTAQEIALSTPARVGRLILVSTSYGGPFLRENVKLLSPIVGEDIGSHMRKFKNDPKGLAKFITGPRVKREDPEAFQKFCWLYTANRPPSKVIVQHLITGGQFSSWGRVHTIDKPTLVVHGDADMVLHYTGGEKLAGQIPGARFWKLPEIGHMPMVERPDVYTRMVDFLRGDDVGTQAPDDSPPAPSEAGRRIKEVWQDMFNMFQKDKGAKQ